MKSFPVTFKLTMPGATRATEYQIDVMADNRTDALTLAEAQWLAKTSDYGVNIVSAKEVQG